MDSAVQRCFGGLAEPAATIDLIEACCEALCAAALDEQERYLVDFIGRSAGLLREESGQAAGPDADFASVRIELMKGIWRLDARLLSRSERSAPCHT
jgi:hypothetical protein